MSSTDSDERQARLFSNDMEKAALEKSSQENAEDHSKVNEEDHDDLQRLGLASGEGNSIVKRDLKQRHIAMIALGGTIGTGLFVGLGQSLSSAGPLSALLGYTFMGFLVWSLMIALGEMAAALPVAGGFAHHAARFVEPAMGSALAWSYWFSYGITLPTEISASALVISYWDPNMKINPAAWVTIFMVSLTFQAKVPFTDLLAKGRLL